MISEKVVEETIRQYGTPEYIFDLQELKKCVAHISYLLGDKVSLCYAMKANPFLVRYLDAYVDKFEVCSPGEYTICKREGISSEKIIMSGVYKSYQDIEKTFQEDFRGIYTIESLEQYKLFKECTRKHLKKIKVLVRYTSGNQFGIDRECVFKIIAENRGNELIEIIGLHFFSGTQKKDKSLIKKEIEELDTLVRDLENVYDCKLRNIEYGPGLFFDYFGDRSGSYEDAVYLSGILEEYKVKYKVTVEMGRYLCASCGQYVTSVVDVKKNNERNYCIVDGGIHHLNYYGQISGVKVPSVCVLHHDSVKGRKEKWSVCGALCTAHDILLKNYEIEDIGIGDVFIFNNVGAYSVTEASYLFLSRDLPKIVVVDEKENVELIREVVQASDINIRQRRK